MFDPCFIEQYLVPFLVLQPFILMGKRGQYCCFTISFFLMSCQCPMALPRGATGWSAVCDCGIS